MVPIRTPRDLGAAIREQRRRQNLSQAELASRIAANRRWVIEVERGKPGAELGRVLQVLEALGMRWMLDAPGVQADPLPRRTPTRAPLDADIDTDIDAIVERARKP